MTFSEKVKFVRKQLNYSQEELARKLEVSFATVNRWENGSFKPSKMAVRIFDMFCVEKGIMFEEPDKCNKVL